MKAIPTVYKGVQMRSRLEATWAAFWDALGWQWDYEPVDLDGWIPDFRVNIGRGVREPISLLVEVKPIAPDPSWGLVGPTADAVLGDMVRNQANGLLVGERPWNGCIGALVDPPGRCHWIDEPLDDDGGYWYPPRDELLPLALSSHHSRGKNGPDCTAEMCLIFDAGVWHPFCGGAQWSCMDGIDPNWVEERWVRAKNAVQWRSPRPSTLAPAVERYPWLRRA